jgi:CheY-like chemotaxis protein
MGARQEPAAVDILIAEDDPVTRQALREVLEHEGYRCAEAASGEEALQIAELSPPRLALLDVMMPGPDGFSIARQLHTDARTREVRVVFLTARNDAEARREARDAGCSMLLAKPIDFDGLLDALSVALYFGSQGDEESG